MEEVSRSSLRLGVSEPSQSWHAGNSSGGLLGGCLRGLAVASTECGRGLPRARLPKVFFEDVQIKVNFLFCCRPCSMEP